MQKIIQHEKYGEIKYRESFWTGNAEVSIGGVPLNKTGKKTFEYMDGETMYPVEAKGNVMSGVTLYIGDEAFPVCEKAKWYEYVLSAFIFVFILVWGNVPALVKLLPLVGGAIGGGIAGLFFVLSLFGMRLVRKPVLKVLVFLACFAATILICWGIAMAILSAAK
ncbi:MAG: hypothetical protein K2G44_01170 [Clostridia bacterium]|nr:hypothetical protein [Clostridia bacterium]